MTLKTNSWSEADLERLRTYASEGRSVYRIAAALRRSVAAVRTMAQRVDVQISNNKQRLARERIAHERNGFNSEARHG